MKPHTYASLIGSLALTCFIVGGFFLLLLPAAPTSVSLKNAPSVKVSEEYQLSASFLDGRIKVGVIPEIPFAVSIDNRPEARPQYGLSKAALVYESLVEGGATRYLAVFQNSEAVRIGPVRSARVYFAEIAEELGAIFAHSGGSPDALALIKARNLKDLEEISYLGTQYFWRDEFISGPHNLFTSADLLRKAALFRGYDITLFPGDKTWRFGEMKLGFGEVQGAKVGRISGRIAVLAAPFESNELTDRDTAYARLSLPSAVQSGAARVVSIDWSAGEDFDVKYIFHEEDQRYVREQGGEVQRDALDGSPLEARTVIIQHVPEETVLDAEGRLRIEILGSGPAEVARRGEVVYGTWQKSKYNERTRYFDNLGEEIIFDPGQLWIEIVPGAREVTFSG